MDVKYQGLTPDGHEYRGVRDGTETVVHVQAVWSGWWQVNLSQALGDGHDLFDSAFVGLDSGSADSPPDAAEVGRVVEQFFA